MFVGSVSYGLLGYTKLLECAKYPYLLVLVWGRIVHPVRS